MLTVTIGFYSSSDPDSGLNRISVCAAMATSMKAISIVMRGMLKSDAMGVINSSPSRNFEKPNTTAPTTTSIANSKSENVFADFTSTVAARKHIAIIVTCVSKLLITGSPRRIIVTAQATIPKYAARNVFLEKKPQSAIKPLSFSNITCPPFHKEKHFFSII